MNYLLISLRRAYIANFLKCQRQFEIKGKKKRGKELRASLCCAETNFKHLF